MQASFEHAIEESLGERVVVEDLTPRAQLLLVGREDDGPSTEATLVDVAPEDIGGRGDVVEVADLIFMVVTHRDEDGARPIPVTTTKEAKERGNERASRRSPMKSR